MEQKQSVLISHKSRAGNNSQICSICWCLWCKHSHHSGFQGTNMKLKLQYFGHPRWRLTHWKRPWYWERLKAGEGDDRGWDGWTASAIQWTWVWASSRSWQWTGRPGVLQSMGSQRVGHDWATELNWTWCRIKVNWKEMQSSGSPKHTNGLGASSDLFIP